VGDHYRTRLTHTLEVAQISRDMARTLGLNEDLAECIALAHDLGHPPFGHAGEDALNTWMSEKDSGFEHNQQSLRIVTVLDHRSSQYTGLNLNTEVLEGLMKHRTPFDEGIETRHSPSLEAQIVNIADEIAYTGHDTDDGLRAELFTIEDLESVQLIQDAKKAAEENDTSLRGALIHMLVMDIYANTGGQHPVQFSPKLREKLDDLRSFLWKNMYLHPQVQENANHGKEIVIALCNHYFEFPSPKVDALMQKHGSDRAQAVKDYVSGMTDAYAVSNFEALPPQQGDA
jgi:dGTPase